MIHQMRGHVKARFVVTLAAVAVAGCGGSDGTGGDEDTSSQNLAEAAQDLSEAEVHKCVQLGHRPRTPSCVVEVKNQDSIISCMSHPACEGKDVTGTEIAGSVRTKLAEEIDQPTDNVLVTCPMGASVGETVTCAFAIESASRDLRVTVNSKTNYTIDTK